MPEFDHSTADDDLISSGGAAAGDVTEGEGQVKKEE